MNTTEFAQEVADYINAQRDAEDLYGADESAYSEWADAQEVPSLILIGAEAVWDAGYCDYVDANDVLDALIAKENKDI